MQQTYDYLGHHHDQFLMIVIDRMQCIIIGIIKFAVMNHYFHVLPLTYGDKLTLKRIDASVKDNYIF